MTQSLLTRSLKELPETAPTSGVESFVVAVGFALIICSFMIGTFANFSIKAGTVVQFENRNISGFPHLRMEPTPLTMFPRSFEQFFNDRFALRSALVYPMSFLKYKFFDLSTRKEKVLVGKAGWLFYMDGGDEETLRRSPLMSKEELAGWAKMLEERRVWCVKHGIIFYYAIAPTKSTIYREYVPDEYTALNDQTRAEQLMDYLRTHTKVEVVDMRVALKTEKKRGLLFFKTDSHWNGLGSYLGYRNVIADIKHEFPSVKPLELKDMRSTHQTGVCCDLPALCGLHGYLIDNFDLYTPKNGQTWRLSANPPPPADIMDLRKRTVPFATESDSSCQVKAFFIRDSFWLMAQPYFSETFKRAYFYWSEHYGFPADQIAREKPDVVVMEMVERSLARPIPENPDELRHP